MSWKNWNKADKTLLTALVLFCFFTCLHFQYPHSLLAQGLMFCAEAALVGGIADWFAVTALFRKPLGFGWHTAILPRRRQTFMDASARMLQTEFFGKVSLVKKIKKVDLQKYLVEMLSNNKDALAKWLTMCLMNYLHNNQLTIDSHLQKMMKEKMSQLSIEKVWQALEAHQDKKRGLFIYLASEMEKLVAKEETYHFLLGKMEQYKNEKTENPMFKLFGGIAESMDVINLPEATNLLQQQCLEICHQIQVEGTADNQEYLALVENLLEISQKNTELKQDFDSLWWNVIHHINVNNTISIGKILAMPDMEQYMSNSIGQILDRFIYNQQGNKELQILTNLLLYQVASRGILQAREMIGEIAREVLSSMTDEQLNRLVYDKAEEDFLWIRMNGSVVGATVGMVIFVATQLLQQWK